MKFDESTVEGLEALFDELLCYQQDGSGRYDDTKDNWKHCAQQLQVMAVIAGIIANNKPDEAVRQYAKGYEPKTNG